MITVAGTAVRQAPERTGLVQLALAKLGQVLCRHEYLLMCPKERMFLWCVKCGRETVGFQILDPDAASPHVVNGRPWF